MSDVVFPDITLCA